MVLSSGLPCIRGTRGPTEARVEGGTRETWKVEDLGGLSAPAYPDIGPPVDESEAMQLALAVGNGTGQHAEAAWVSLRLIGEAAVEYLVRAYAESNRGEGRAALVFHCMRWADRSNAAFNLAIRALSDRSRSVRYRACMLLALAQRLDALTALEPALSHPDQMTVADAQAAVNAIKAGSPVLFIDRNGSGRVQWEV